MSFHLFCNDFLDAVRRNAPARLIGLRGASSTAYYIAIRATFARNYHEHGDPIVIIALDLGPCDAKQECACIVHAFESFCIGPVECALRVVPFGVYDGSIDDGPESGFAKVALAAAAVLRADVVGATGGGTLAWVVG